MIFQFNDIKKLTVQFENMNEFPAQFDRLLLENEYLVQENVPLNICIFIIVLSIKEYFLKIVILTRYVYKKKKITQNLGLKNNPIPRIFLISRSRFLLKVDFYYLSAPGVFPELSVLSKLKIMKIQQKSKFIF